MARAYRIRDWKKYFEKAQTRFVKAVTWVPVPNKHDGKGYRRLIRMRDGELLYAAWVLICAVASKCPVRGTLIDGDGEILSAKDLSDNTGGREKTFEKALKVLCSKEIGWMEQFDVDSTSQHVATHQNDFETPPSTAATTGQDRTGQDRTLPPTEVCSEPPKGDFEPTSDSETGHSERACPPPASESPGQSKAVMAFPCVGKGPTEWTLTDAKVAEYRQSFPGIDVLGACRRARQWCIDNPRKRKTFRGMAAFVSRWLAREQDRDKSLTNGARPEQFSGIRQVATEHSLFPEGGTDDDA